MADATQALALLHEQAEKLRAEIVALNLTTASHDFAVAQAMALVEANGALVISALHAETVAESAMGELDEVTRVSQQDVLTGISNRVLMLDRLKSAISLSRRRGTRAALLFVDLDRFKQINDTLGHAVGDEVLCLIAARLQSSVRDSDTVSRHGGDEFLILLQEIAQPADAALIAAKMLQAVAQPGPPPLPGISVSIGIAICPDDGVEPEILIANADAAMYQSKQRGSGGFAFHGALPADTQSPRADNDESTLLENEPRLWAIREVNEQLPIAASTTQELHRHAQRFQKEQLVFLAKMAREIRNHQADAESAAKTLGRSASLAVLLQLREAIDQQVIHITDQAFL